MLDLFNKGSRQRLQTLRLTLSEWDRSVPARARGFHRQREQLQTDIDACLDGFWIGPEAVERLEQRFQPLAGMVEGLRELLQRVEQRELELRQLQQDTAAEREWLPLFQERYGAWEDLLGRLGTRCERQADLFQDEDSLDCIEQGLRLQRETLPWFRQAQELLRTLGSNIETARLEAEWPELQRCWQDRGGDATLIQRLQALCRPLQTLIDRPTPPELHDLSSLLADVRGWSRELEPDPDTLPALRQLEQRQRQWAADWRQRDQGELQALVAEVATLRERLAGQAGAIRRDRLQLLTDWLMDLEHACGPQPEIRQRLETLQQRTVDRYQLHRDWLTQFDQADSYFRAIADTQAPALERRLQERRREWQEPLDRLRSMPLAAAVEEAVTAIEVELGADADVHGAETVLRALRHGRDHKQRLHELLHQADRDIEELARGQRELAEQHQELQREAARLGVAIPDLSEAIAGLSAGSENRSLEQARQRRRQLEEQLAAGRRQFLDHCRHRLAERLQAAEQVCAALQQAGSPAPTLTPVVLTATAGVSEAAASVAAFQQIEQQLQQAVTQALQQAEAGRQRQLAELNAAPLETLDPHEREEVEWLLASLQDPNWQPAADPPAGLLRLAAVLQRGDAFLERLFADQRELQERLAQLKQRLRVFGEEQLKQHCPPEWLDRLQDLIYGLPEPLEPSHRHQVEAAEDLCRRLERQARRLAAREAGLLEQDLRVAPRREEVAALLAELEQAHPGRPLSLALRRRLRRAVVDRRRSR